MVNRFIIYLGGSITQSTNIKYLKKKYKIILIDQNPNCYCRKYCDIFLNISVTDVKKIIFYLKKILKNKNYSIVDCFGVAHYSYPAVNKIKLKYVKNFKDDKFLMYKHIQKRVIHKYNITPDYYLLPSFKTISKNHKKYSSNIYEFYKEKNYNIFVKSDGMHQGRGIIKISGKKSKKYFIKEYYKEILKLYKNTKYIYLEEKVNGKLLNIDFIKKKEGETIFLPVIYRDKVILRGKKKYLSVFQYLNNVNEIKIKEYMTINSLIKKVYNGISVFGTIDAITDKNSLNILEISPHFHNAKIFEFLSNQIVLDIYLKKLKNKNTESSQKRQIGGYIFVHTLNEEVKKLHKFVKKNSVKFQIDYIDIKKREKNLEKYASIKKNFHIVYFKTKSYKILKRIYQYLEKKKKLIY